MTGTSLLGDIRAEFGRIILGGYLPPLAPPLVFEYGVARWKWLVEEAEQKWAQATPHRKWYVVTVTT